MPAARLQTKRIETMKTSVEKFHEAGVAACVVVTAIVVVILMVAHALWKNIAARLSSAGLKG